MKKRIIITISIITILGLFLIPIYLFNSIGESFTKSSRTITKILHDKKETLFITIDENAQYPHAMDLTMSGEINGSGILKIGINDSIYYRTDTISDKFLIDYKSMDWYDENCVIKYEPISAAKGNLKIECIIYSSKK